MGYVNNGTERSLKVSINKVVGGNQVQGYPKTYDGQVSWGNLSYPTLSDDQFKQLSEVDFNARYAAFVAYVESVEYGADFDTDLIGDGATRTGANCISTTTTTAAATSYSFAVKYGALPVNACNGAVGVVYAGVPTPGVGTILYKDAGLTQRWDTASAILFVSPALYGNEVAGVAIVDTDVYDVGEIMLLTGYICGSSTDVTTSVPVVCVAFTSQLGWGVSITEACQMATSNPGQYYGNNANFTLSTTISASPTCSTTLGGYYSDGNTWKYSPDGTTLTTSGLCAPVPPVYKRIFYNINGITGGRFRIYNGSGVLVDLKTQDGAKTGSVTMTNSGFRIVGEWFSGSGNKLRMRVCTDGNEMFYDDNITASDPIAQYIVAAINLDYYVYFTSGDVAVPQCPV